MSDLFHAGHGSTTRKLLRDRRHRAVADSAGDDQFEILEIGGDVERESMAGNAARDMHADCGDLLLLDVRRTELRTPSSGVVYASKSPGGGSRRSVRRGVFTRGRRSLRPYTGQSANSLRRNAEIAAGSNQRFFHAPHELDCADPRREPSKIKDGIANELSGTVKGNIATAIALKEFNTLIP